MRTSRRAIGMTVVCAFGLAAILVALAVRPGNALQQTGPTPTEPEYINGHAEEEDPAVSAELRTRLEAANVPDPGVTVTVSMTVTINRRTGERSRGLALWSYVHVSQSVSDLADCQGLGDLTRRVIDVVGGLSSPAVRKTPGLSLTFVAGTNKRTVVYNSDEVPALSGTSSSGIELLRRGRYVSTTPGDWTCFP